MQTSADGNACLRHHEGEVLRAYRDVVGVWTIGVGLTAASGVVVPRAGMVITREESARLLAEALKRNYEPAVNAAMPGARQHEFDAGVSFHFNTGAIAKASWVRLWRADAARSAVRAGLMAWNKAGGKVIAGLTRRREDEARLLLEGAYVVKAATAAPAPQPVATGAAVWAINLSMVEKAKIGADLYKLGFTFNLDGNGPSAIAVRRFQEAHGLTVDGIIGRATVTALQRRLDAITKAKPAAAAPLAAAALPTGNMSADLMSLPPVTDWIVLGLASAYALWVAYQYRDAIAAKVNTRLPGVASYLRSF